MQNKAPYVLSSSAFIEFLDNSEEWRAWYYSKVPELKPDLPVGSDENLQKINPHALFVSANTFGQARLNNASFLLAQNAIEEKDDELLREIEESQAIDELLFEISNAAWKRRVLPVSARVMNLVTEAFRMIDEFQLSREDENSWNLSIDAITEYATALNWDATLIYSSAYDFEAEELFEKLVARNPRFRIEDMAKTSIDPI